VTEVDEALGRRAVDGAGAGLVDVRRTGGPVDEALSVATALYDEDGDEAQKDDAKGGRRGDEGDLPGVDTGPGHLGSDKCNARTGRRCDADWSRPGVVGPLQEADVRRGAAQVVGIVTTGLLTAGCIESLLC
jgi:hypothetical protein